MRCQWARVRDLGRGEAMTPRKAVQAESARPAQQAKVCCFTDCPGRVPPEEEFDFCDDCCERFWRMMRRMTREKAVAWNYRVVRYKANGEVLFGLMEVHYDAAGIPNGYALASVLHWQSLDELQGTLALMTEALLKPELHVDGDVAEHIIAPESK